MSDNQDTETKTPELFEEEVTAGPAVSAPTQLHPQPVDPMAHLMSKMSGEQRAAVAATALEDMEDDKPVESLGALRAVSKIMLSVWEEHPNRLKVAYLPVVAADPRVLAQYTRLMGLAADLAQFGFDLQRKGKDLQERAAHADETGETFDNLRLGDLFSQEQFDALIAEYTDRMAIYLTTVCPSWSLSEPLTKETLLSEEGGLAVMVPIFAATRRYEETKNAKGSVSITTS
jgi:hypothetical protein